MSLPQISTRSANACQNVDSPVFSLIQAEIAENLGIFLLDRQQVVAGGTIVGNRLTVGAGVRAVVAAEAAGKVVVPQIVGMHAPVHVHFGKDVAKINFGDV